MIAAKMALAGAASRLERGGMMARLLVLLLLVVSGTLGAARPRPLESGTVVVLGDSLTYGTTPHGRVRQPWPALLERRLGPRWHVVNAGRPGNTLVPAAAPCVPCGPAGVVRFRRDVLAVPGVRVVVLALGLNDLLQGNRPGQVAGGLQELARRAHARGLRVVVLTLTPDGPTPGLRPATARLNAWIRAQTGVLSGAGDSGFDAVVDAAAVLRDPQDAARLRPAYDSGDGRHPGAAGYRAMARAIPLRAITG